MRYWISILSLLVLLDCASQERFFTYLDGWTNLGLIERPDDYLSYGTPSANGVGRILFQTIDFNGTDIDSWELEVDTSLSLATRRVDSFIEYDDEYFGAHSFAGESGEKSYGLFLRFDSNMQLETSVVFDFGELQTFCYSLTPSHVEGRFILTSGINDSLSAPRTGISEIDSEGTIIWHQEFVSEADPSVDWLLPWHILPTPDGGYLLTALDLYEPNSGFNVEHHIALIKIDSVGEEEWRIQPGNPNYWSEPGWPVLLDDGTVYFCWTDPRVVSNAVDQFNFNATVHFAMIDLVDGAILASDEYSSILPTFNDEPVLGHDYFLYQSQILSDGNILLSGYDTYHAFLMKVNQAGDYIWHRTILNPNQLGQELDVYGRFHVKGVRETSDGGFICGGEFNVFPGGEIFPGGIQTAFAMKLDSFGCLNEGCQLVGLSEDEIGSLIVYPNPTSNELRVELPSRGWGQRWQIDLFDALGRAIPESSYDTQNNQDSQFLTLNLERLPSGLYLLRLLSSEGVYVARVQKE